VKQNLTHKPTVIAVAARREAEETVLAYANLFTAPCNEHAVTIRLNMEDPFVVPWGMSATSATNGCIRSAVTRIAREKNVSLIVSEWLPNPRDMQDALRFAHEITVPAIFIRDPERKPYRRILAATAGGPNVLHQLWVARQMACALNLPVHFLRIVHPAVVPAAPPPFEDPTAALDACSRRLLHMDARMEVKEALDVGDAITASVREGDILVLGAPSALRIASDFEGSLPHTIANRTSAPLILLSAPPDSRIRLRRLFWGGLIQTDLRPRDKTHAISALIENLAHHNQIAHSSVADTLDRALRREAIMSTAVDCDTAFPHVKLPGFLGVAGSMAICPEGVDFDSPDGLPTRFLYLLVTPDNLCDEYLATLGMIARRVLRRDVRDALLQCQTPAQALDILEPDENPHPDSEGSTPAICSGNGSSPPQSCACIHDG